MNGGGNVPKAKINDKAINELYQTLERLGADAEGVAKQGIFEGAGLIADAVRAGIDTINSDGPSDKETARREMQKAGLRAGLTTAPIQPFKGGIYGGVGFDGYNAKGQPNQLIARVFNSGTSFSSKQPFFESAVRRTRSAAKQRVIDKMNEEFEKITKG